MLLQRERLNELLQTIVRLTPQPVHERALGVGDLVAEQADRVIVKNATAAKRTGKTARGRWRSSPKSRQSRAAVSVKSDHPHT
ncbi:MAG TPA: hypothetical protein VH025_05080 [Solirubrobacteraceae bacterium]|nr:hypothetical protein [Solirubrobacteraceae bacterium]